MSANILAILMTLLLGAALAKYWRQIVMLLLAVIAVVFCIGAYQIALFFRLF